MLIVKCMGWQLSKCRQYFCTKFKLGGSNHSNSNCNGKIEQALIIELLLPKLYPKIPNVETKANARKKEIAHLVLSYRPHKTKFVFS